MNLKGNLLGILSAHNACSEAVEWVRSGKFRSAAAAWDACPRADWMLWALEATKSKAASDSIQTKGSHG